MCKAEMKTYDSVEEGEGNKELEKEENCTV